MFCQELRLVDRMLTVYRDTYRSIGTNIVMYHGTKYLAAPSLIERLGVVILTVVTN